MYFPKNRTMFVSVLAVSLLLSAQAFSQTGSASLSQIHIDNFGRTNEHYFRGAQPSGNDYSDLARIGVRTVIDLTNDGRGDEPGLVRRAGMNFYRIPMTTGDRPSEAKVSQFLKLVNDPANWPVFVHCQ